MLSSRDMAKYVSELSIIDLDLSASSVQYLLTPRTRDILATLIPRLLCYFSLDSIVSIIAPLMDLDSISIARDSAIMQHRYLADKRLIQTLPRGGAKPLSFARYRSLIGVVLSECQSHDKCWGPREGPRGSDRLETFRESYGWCR